MTTSTRFSHRAKLSARKPASFLGEQLDTVVKLLGGFAKMLSCQTKARTRWKFWHFAITKEAHQTIRVTEQPTRAKKKVMNFVTIFSKSGQSNLVLVLVLVLDSKSP